MVDLYLIRNVVNEKLYVGITRCGYHKRWLAHQKQARKQSVYALHCAVRKHGVNNFVCERLATLSSWDEACKAEREAIIAFSSHTSEHGYNMTAGGDGFASLSDDARHRIALAHRRENLSPSTIEAMSAAKRGTRLSSDTKQKMSMAHTGKKFSEEHRKKIGLANRVENCSPEKRMKLSKLKSKAIQQLTATGELVAEFSSMMAASAVTGVHATNISRCCLGNCKLAGGFAWRYLTPCVSLNNSFARSSRKN